MKPIYAFLVLLCLAVALHFLRSGEPPPPRLIPTPTFSSRQPVGAWDSVAAVADKLWVTDKQRGEIIVIAPKTGKQKVLRDGLALRAPNGIAAIKHPNGWFVFVVDNEQNTVLRLSEKGDVLGRFGADFFTAPRGIAAFEKEKKVHLLVTDQGKHNGCVWHIVLDAKGEVASKKSMAPVRGEVESVAYLAAENAVLVANETSRWIEIFPLDGHKPLGILGKGHFRGEPEGLSVWQEQKVIFAIDQTADGRILCFAPDVAAPRSIQSQPPLVKPDGSCLAGPVLFVVSGDSSVSGFEFKPVGDQ